jgi:hypothetical protein
LEEKHVSFPVIWNSLTLQLAKAYYYYYWNSYPWI